MFVVTEDVPQYLAGATFAVHLSCLCREEEAGKGLTLWALLAFLCLGSPYMMMRQ